MKTVLAIAVAVAWWHSGVCGAAEVTSVYSPDKRLVLVWFDTELESPLCAVRTIFLRELPAGDPVFSLVTFPRYTKAVWSPDSEHCLILDAPDNGNVNTWLFTAARTGEQPPAVVIHPLRSLEKAFYAQYRGGTLWRPAVEEISWLDDETLEFLAADNLGSYKIVLKAAAPDHPLVKPAPAQP